MHVCVGRVQHPLYNGGNSNTPQMVTCRDMWGEGGVSPYPHRSTSSSPYTSFPLPPLVPLPPPPPPTPPPFSYLMYAAWGSHYKKNFSYSSRHAVRVIHYCSEQLPGLIVQQQLQLLIFCTNGNSTWNIAQ